MVSSSEAAVRFKNLLSPLQIGSFTVRNRLLSTAHGTGMGSMGLPSPRMRDYWLSKAKGGIGLIITQADNVDPSGGRGGGGIQLWREEIIPPLRQISAALREAGAGFVLQMNHSGRSTYGGWMALEPVWSASAIQSSYEYNNETPFQMREKDIRDVVKAYGSAARRAQAGGVDGVEIHAAHDYLLQQFMSPKSNKRTDAYGGSEDNRLRFLDEVLGAVRADVTEDFCVGIRINGDEHIEGGLTIDDMERIIQKITSRHKIDYVSVSGGSSGRNVIIPVNIVPPGMYVPMAARIKQVVDVPVFCVGGITDPVMAEGILERHEADMVGMTRAHIADPEIGNKVREGRLDEIRACIRCMEGCLNSPVGMSCVVNPSVGREAETELTPAPVKKKVMVIGGGIAGMQAAWAAAMRGHEVSLYEKDPQLGGQLLVSAKAPARAEMAEPARYFTRQFQLLEVPIHLGVTADEELVERENPDAIIVATGGIAQWPPIEGIEDGKADGVNVYLARDVVDGKVEVTGDKVIVYSLDYGMEPLSTADFLVDRGKEVEILSPYPHIGQVVERLMMRPMMLSRLTDRGVKISILTGIKAVRNGQIIANNFPPFGSKEWPVEGVTDLVISAGSEANDDLWRSLEGKGKEVIPVGEAQAPRLLFRSALEGFLAGHRI